MATDRRWPPNIPRTFLFDKTRSQRELLSRNSFDYNESVSLESCLAFIKSTPFFSVAASRIRYEITSGNIGGAFAVKNMTGAIYVAGALDYETRKRVGIAINVILP